MINTWKKKIRKIKKDLYYVKQGEKLVYLPSDRDEPRAASINDRATLLASAFAFACASVRDKFFPTNMKKNKIIIVNYKSYKYQK